MTYLILVFCLVALMQSFKKTTLACGLFGYVGSDDVDMMRIKMLGVYNLSRGKHSCGISYDETIVKGTGNYKEWDKFIENVDFPDFINNQVVIGHTRAATVGDHNEKNAHPFDINGSMVGAHNGTIDNIDDLTAKYGVDVEGITVDSHKLLKIIQEKGYDVLNHYLGYAALLFRNYNENNVIYIYHGASREIVNGPVYIERPLFYQTIDTGCYFSSIRESLEAIMSYKYNEKNQLVIPEEVPVNKVIRIDYSQGKLNHSIVFKANREEVNIGLKAYKDNKRNSYVRSYVPPATRALPASRKIEYMTPEEVKLGHTNYATWVDGFYSSLGKRLNGLFSVSNAGVIKHRDVLVLPSDMKCYFYRGIMIKDHVTYNNLWRNTKAINKTVGNPLKYAKMLSRYSKYPVPVEGNNVERIWYWQGRAYSYLSFAPYFTSRRFEVHAGKNVSVVTDGNFDLNTGEKAEIVKTSIDFEENNFAADIDLSLFNNSYKNTKDIVMSLPEDNIAFLYEYTLRVILENSDNPSYQKAELKAFELFDDVVKHELTVREAFENKLMTFEEFLSLLNKEEEEEAKVQDENTEDAVEVEVVEVSAEELLAQLKQDENKETEKALVLVDDDDDDDELFLECLEDVVVNVASTLKSLKDIEGAESEESEAFLKLLNEKVAEIGLLLADHLTTYKHEELLYTLVKEFKPVLTV